MENKNIGLVLDGGAMRGNVTFHPARLWINCNNKKVSATAHHISRERKFSVAQTLDSRIGCSVTLPRGNGRFVNRKRLIRVLPSRGNGRHAASRERKACLTESLLNR